MPRDGSVTHLGIRFQGGKGTVWCDEIALYRLPPDEPIVTGPPRPPPHGQITVRDGHLVGEHGRRVRLWVSPAHDPPFFCFGVASLDGKALPESQRALLVLTTYGENRGRELWSPEEAPMGDLGKVFVKAWGYGPPDIARPQARVHLGRRWRWRLYDFRLREVGRGEGEVLHLPQDTPLFYAELRR